MISKLEDEKLEYWSAKAREEFFDEADSEVYLGKIEQLIDKLRVEQQSLSAKKPVVASSTSPASPPSIKSPAPSKPAFSTSKPLDRKKLTLKQAAEYLGSQCKRCISGARRRRFSITRLAARHFSTLTNLTSMRAKGEVKPVSEAVKSKGAGLSEGCR